MSTMKYFLNKRLLITLLFVSAFVIGTLAPIKIINVFAATPPCTNSGCDDKDPQTYTIPGSTYCGADGTTDKTATKASLRVERRHSALCQAKWERSAHTGATTSDSLYIAGSLFWPATRTNSYNVESQM
jgi:hypothetical protein